MGLELEDNCMVYLMKSSMLVGVGNDIVAFIFLSMSDISQCKISMLLTSLSKHDM